jgi:hypothetical protein
MQIGQIYRIWNEIARPSPADHYNHLLDSYATKKFRFIPHGHVSWCEKSLSGRNGFGDKYIWIGFDHDGPGLDRFATHIAAIEERVRLTGVRGRMDNILTASLLLAMSITRPGMTDLRLSLSDIRDIEDTLMRSANRYPFDWKQDDKLIPIIHAPHPRIQIIDTPQQYVALLCEYTVRTLKKFSILKSVFTPESIYYSDLRFEITFTSRIPDQWLKENMKGIYRSKTHSIACDDVNDVIILKLTFSNISKINDRTHNASGGTNRRPRNLKLDR